MTFHMRPWLLHCYVSFRMNDHGIPNHILHAGERSPPKAVFPGRKDSVPHVGPPAHAFIYMES